MDEEYLQRKDRRTVRDDKREVMPLCVITVSAKWQENVLIVIFFTYRKFEEDTLVWMDSIETMYPPSMLKLMLRVL